MTKSPKVICMNFIRIRLHKNSSEKEVKSFQKMHKTSSLSIFHLLLSCPTANFGAIFC